MTRIAFLVTHLSGTGHLVRVIALARAVAEAGGLPLVISGGRSLPHLDTDGVAMVEIPALAVPDFDFATPRGPDGAPADAALFEARRAAIETALADFRPHVLVTETFPLGRRRLAAEFEAAIAAVPAAAVVCSVRDIPEPPGKPERLAEAADRLRRHYDAVLVHGDPALVPLSASWDLPDDLAPMIEHTGYVGHAAPARSAKGSWVLASGGGGGFGRPLMEIALNAAANSPRTWHMMLGGATAEQDAAEFSHPQYNVFAHPPLPHFLRLVAGSACSVSHCGYNTVMDLAATGTMAVIVPFEDHGQREQRLRADALARFDGITVLSMEGLTWQALNAAVEDAVAGRSLPGRPFRPPNWPEPAVELPATRRRLPIDTGGAARSAVRLIALGRGRGG